MKRYLIVENKTGKENVLSLSVEYQKGGINWFNGNQEKRGYFLYATPENYETHKMAGKEYGSFVTQLGKGLKICLLEVDRRGKKSTKKAEQLAKEKEDYLLDIVKQTYGITIDKEAML